MVGLKDFSLDASSNDTAAPPILWQEGQPAATVNNSARAMMAALACWLADNTIIRTTGGATNTYQAPTQQQFTTLDFTRSFNLTVVADASNSGPATLNPDGTVDQPWHRVRGTLMGPGDIVPGLAYRVRWDPDAGVFITDSPTISPPGMIAPFVRPEAVPSGWLVCDGRALQRAAYIALFSVVQGTYGVPDSTTFNIPDFRGRTLFGVDGGAGRLTGAGGLGPAIGAVGGTEAVVLTVDQLAAHGHGGSTVAAGGHDHGGTVAAAGQHSHGGATAAAGNHTHGASTTTAGSHAHSGTTNSAGTHGHSITYSIGTAGSGSTNRVVTDLEPNGSNNAGGATDPAGAHTHDFTTAAAGDHSHGVTVAAVGDHAHGITADGQHAHGITAVGDHTHGLNINTSGSGQAHANMPPGAVVIWAIKA